MTSSDNNSRYADYLIILGCRVRGSEAEETLKMRIACAAKYLSEHQDTVAVACGGIVHSDQLISEAQAIKNGLELGGIATQRIILEEQSKTTVENFVNAKKIIEEAEKGKDRKAVLAFLSSDFHIERSSIIASECGVEAFPVSAASPVEQFTKNKLREKAIMCLRKSQIRPRS